MKAAIVTIGDEILIGQITDTNSTFIAQRLSAMGFVVGAKMSISDNATQITEVLESCLASYNLTIVTGGLGPTKDDITKKTLAKMFGCEMRRDQAVADHVKAMLEARGITYNELNQEQSLVPECCQTLFNEHGTAPGMWFTANNSNVLISLPGVPFEMKALMTDVVEPKLKGSFELRESIHTTMITSGLPESMLAERIEKWEDALPNFLKLAYLPGPGRVRLRLSAYNIENDKAAAVKAEIKERFKALEGLISEYILGFENASMEQIVHDRLIESNKTLAIAESCTGGAISAAFTAMAGASKYLLAGVTSYSNDSKVNILGVSAADIEQHGAVSETVAIQMAEGVRKITGADYAIATTGIAGPDGGSEEKPVGTVYFGIATATRSYAILKNCGTERSQVIWRATAHALTMLRSEIK
ncbi:MAG: competence/damage-inducible protein A [Rikenellaceae bacterium]